MWHVKCFFIFGKNFYIFQFLSNYLIQYIILPHRVPNFHLPDIRKPKKTAEQIEYAGQQVKGASNASLTRHPNFSISFS